ncbi:hypothetical protein [Pontibaca methylaminivorans]|uniref:hypothetical protein n=1 Tax=Pontibaca methylaminivorans TaxID=515897 RepID=UPI002FD9E6C7
MTADRLRQLGAVTEALYMDEHRRIQEILAREAALQASISRLRAQSSHYGDRQMQAIGADLAWEAWRDRSLRDLGMELAQVRAQKLAALDRLRGAFGRNEAVRQLIERAMAERKRLRSRR